MSDDVRRSRAHVEMVTFAEFSTIPQELAAPLLKLGAPIAMLGLYRAASALTLVEGTGGQQLVCFGTIAYSQRACLEPGTGTIVALLDTQRGGGTEVEVIVNSSLEQFVASVGAVLNRYPFDSPQAKGESEENYLDRTSAELHQAANDLKKALSAIDPAAMEDPGRFWLDFIDDVEMGSYSPTD